jgi:cytochrome c oxidase assembly factor CtaG
MYLVTLWILVALGVFMLWADVVRADPSEMPGGGPMAIAIVAIAWPLLLVAFLAVAAVAGVLGAIGDP